MGPLKISCLCVTNRPAFMPWLVWNYSKQTYPNKELIVVSGEPILWLRGAKNIISVGNVAHKRNIALEAATGDAIVWMDDDDWQNPDRLSISADSLKDEYAGCKSSWFMDLWSGKCIPYTLPPGWDVLFNGAIFRTEFARIVRFDESRNSGGTDSYWMRSLEGRANIVNDHILFFWISHNSNISNPVHSKKFTYEISALKSLIGKNWGNTDKHLKDLINALA